MAAITPSNSLLDLGSQLILYAVAYRIIFQMKDLSQDDDIGM
jgi:hypothetical protein